VNVQEYALAGGASFGAQIGSAPGDDGKPPDAKAIVGSYANKTGMYALCATSTFST
jgi:hypothetical protein